MHRAPGGKAAEYQRTIAIALALLQHYLRFPAEGFFFLFLGPSISFLAAVSIKKTLS